MRLQWVRSKLWQFQNLALITVVVAAYISTFVLTRQPYSPLQVFVMLLLGVIFLAVDLIWLEHLYVWNSKFAPHIYFVVQVPIAGTLLYFSQGNAWLILMPLAAQAVFSYSLRGLIAMNALFIAMLMVNMLRLTDDWRMIGQGLVAFQTAFLFVIVFTQILVREQRARTEVQVLADQLGEANRRLREYASQVEELAGAQERNRVAREIHDGLGHYLTALNVQIRAAMAILETDRIQARDAMLKAESLAQEALADVRRSVAALRNSPALSRPLPEMLASLVDESRSTGLVVELNVLGAPRALSPQAELTLFRAAQEGVTNIHKHALASLVQINLEFDSQQTTFNIKDNGVGTQLPQKLSEQLLGGFGLFGLQERVKLLGGSMSVETAPNQGFCFTIVIPG